MSAVQKKFHNFEASLADRITRVSGSMNFVYLHIVFFVGFFLFRPFEIEVFNILLSLEAVFLATFIMVAQNRELELAEERQLEEDKEEQETAEDIEGIEEDIEDIQEDVDQVHADVAEIKKLLSKLEDHLNPPHTK